MDGMFGRNSNRGANLSLYNWRPIESVGEQMKAALMRTPNPVAPAPNQLTGEGNRRELDGAPEWVQNILGSIMENKPQ
jgi:hypothetical protein